MKPEDKTQPVSNSLNSDCGKKHEDWPAFMSNIRDFLTGIREEVPSGQMRLIQILAFISALIFAWRVMSGEFVLTLLGLIVKEVVPLVLLAWGAGLLLAAGKVDVSTAGNATLGG